MVALEKIKITRDYGLLEVIYMYRITRENKKNNKNSVRIKKDLQIKR